MDIPAATQAALPGNRKAPPPLPPFRSIRPVALLLHGPLRSRLVRLLHHHSALRSLLGAGRWFFWRRGLTSLPPRGGGGPPPLRTTAGRHLLRAGVRLREVGAFAVRALGHGVLTLVALLGSAPLHRAPVLSRCVSLRTPTASRGGPGALSLDVAPLAAVATSDVRPYLLVSLGLVSTALKPKSALADEAVCVLVCYRQNHRRRLGGSFAVASLDTRSAIGSSRGS